MSAVVARRQLNLAVKRLVLGRRRKEPGCRLVQVQFDVGAVARTREETAARQAGTETRCQKRDAPGLQRRLDIGIVEGERKVGPPDDPVLYDLLLDDGLEFRPRRALARHHREGGARMEVLGPERPLQVGGEAQPLVLLTADRTDRHAVCLRIAPDAQHQQAVVALTEPFDPHLGSRRIVQALDSADGRAGAVHHTKFHSVVAGLLPEVRTDIPVLIARTTHAEGHALRSRAGKAVGRIVGPAGGQEHRTQP